MRICIDARMMGAGNTRGIGRFIEELMKAMLRLAPQHRYILIVRSEKHPFSQHPSVETLVADIPWYGWREQVYLPGVFRASRADRFFVPHWNVPFLGMPKPFFVFVHDLLLFHEPLSAKISLRHPLVAWSKRLAHRLVVRHAVHMARSVLVPTIAVQQDVLSFFPERKDIQITGEGMPSILPSDAFAPTHIPPYLLSVGSAYPHKGLEDVLRAWPAIRFLYPDLEWWIVGEKDVFMQGFERLVEETGIVGIRFLGRVEEGALAGLYQRALACLFPSRFEGFGLPPLEALAVGCPVVARRIPVLVEVLGEEGVIFFRDGTEDAILAAVRTLYTDPVHARRQAQELAKKLEKTYRWEETARIILTALETA